MRIARFDDNRIGVVRGDTIVDVTDVVDPSPGAWPPVAMNRLIAEFAEFRASNRRLTTDTGSDCASSAAVKFVELRTARTAVNATIRRNMVVPFADGAAVV